METTGRVESKGEVAGRAGHQRVALLVERPAQLPSMTAALGRVAPNVHEAFVWLRVEPFRPPSRTHPSYHVRAHAAAREITEGRIAQRKAEAEVFLSSSNPGKWWVEIDVIADASAALLARRIMQREIDLLVCQGEGGIGRWGKQAAAEASCPLLLVPANPTTTTGGLLPSLAPTGTHGVARLLRALRT